MRLWIARNALDDLAHVGAGSGDERPLQSNMLQAIYKDVECHER